MHLRYVALSLALFLISAAPASADPLPAPGDAGGAFLTGDNPPEHLYTFTGNGGIVHAVDPELLDTEGTFTLDNVPTGATVERALFITGIWDSAGSATNSMQFVFDGQDYGTEVADLIDQPDGEEELLDLAGYVIDVTADVPGNGTYAFSAVPDQGGTGSFGYLLAVVYSDPDAPVARIDLNFGAESLRENASTTGFSTIEPGEATLYIFLEADQPDYSAGEESIAFNGTVIAGGEGSGLFDHNQGPACSFFELPVATVTGENTSTITTGEDWIGWHYAALVSPPAATSTESRSWGSIKSGYRD
ncbi:MAG: DUF3344 domain-containing protein [Candidatus Eisenbacteria bacterium]|nr:DUF3344 domain-containing protein [Candidatus Latescibacterota bacterium]MBD3302538.1 DUF3344 domain-containing protein [Candidatus Eisenbacteria bacterium]